MKHNSERTEILALIFAAHLATDTFNLTSDNQAFTNLNNARAHAATLDDKSVAICNRDGSFKYDGVKPVAAQEQPKEEATKTPEEIEAERLAAEKIALEKAALKALREEYKALAGKGVNNAWSAEEVTAKIAELKAKN